MLFATDKFTLSFGDTAKLTIQYENTTLTNTGKKQAIVEASKDGYTWAQVASIAPESSLPLKIEALYVRLTTDTTVSVVNTDPIPRDTKKSDIAVNINTEALVIKDDLQAYVSKQELNDLVHHPDLSNYVTIPQVQSMIPEVPTPPDISGLASKESVAAKADQTVVDELKLTVATKADTTALVALQTTVTESVVPAINHLNTVKADKTELDTLTEQVAQSKATVGTLATQVTGFQSALDGRVTKEQAEDANHVLLNAIAARATTEQLNALHEEVEQKANQQQVDELTNKALSLEQDKANRTDVETLSTTVKLLQSLIDGEIDGDLLDQTKAEILESLNQTLPDTIKGLIPDSLGQEELTALETKLTEYIAAETNKKANQSHTHSMSDVSGLAEALADKSDAAHTHAWTSISGKPSSFVPSAHSHPVGEIAGLSEALATKANTTHSHTVVDVTGLQEALDSKSPTNHAHTWASITGKPSTFNPSTHTHSLASVTGLQAALDSKLTVQDAEATYAKKTELPQPVDLSGYATKQSVDNLSQAVNALSGTGDVDLTGLATKEELNSKANTEHSHSMSQITGLQEALNTKVSTEQLTTVLSQVNAAPQGWQVLTIRQNLNTMTTQGKYLIRVGSNTNAPITDWIYVVVEVAASDRITQTIWANSESNLMYTRVYNGAWRPWEKITKNAIADITGLQAALDAKVTTTDAKYHAARKAPFASNTNQNFDNLRGGDYLYYKRATHTAAVNPPPLDECVVFAEWCYASNDNHLVVTARSLIDGKIATRSKFQNTWSEWTQLTPSNDFATLRAEVEELKKLEPTGGSAVDITEMCFPVYKYNSYSAALVLQFLISDSGTSLFTSEPIHTHFIAVRGQLLTLRDLRWQISGTAASAYSIHNGTLYTSRNKSSLVAAYGEQSRYTEELLFTHPAVLAGIPFKVVIEYLPMYLDHVLGD